MKRYILVMTSMLFCMLMQGQTPMGDWNSHFSYSNIDYMTQSTEKVYALSSGALISVDKRDESVEFYSKMTGLNGTSITAIEYSSQRHCLVIAYEDGNIDLLSDGGVFNISDFYTKPLTNAKGANSICCYGDMAYLCCEFGIVAINLRKREIAETYYIGPDAAEVNVLGMTVCNDVLYAATANAIYSAPLSSTNLMDYAAWTCHTDLPESGTAISAIASLQGHLWLVQGNHIYQKTPQETAWTSPLPGWGIYSMSTSDQRITFTHGNVLFFSESTDGMTCSQLALPLSAELVISDVQHNDHWLGSDANGLAVIHADQTYNQYKVNGPYSNEVHFMKFFDDVLYATNGYVWAGKADNPSQVMAYRNGQWSGIPHDKLLQDAQSLDPNCNEANDAFGVAVDPLNPNHIYVGSIGSGLYEYRYQNGQYNIQNYYAAGNHDGAKIEVASDIPINLYKYSWVDAPIFDAQGNLWVSNMMAHNPIKCISPQGNWTDYNHSAIMSCSRIFNLFIDRKNPNYLWFCNKRSGAGIGLIDTKGTPYDTSDDQFRFFTKVVDQDGKELTFTYVYCAAQDLTGNIWIATDLGPLILSYTQNPITYGLNCQHNIIPRQDGTNLGDYLLDGVKINAIAVDGGNRKWIGTDNNGLYLFDDTGMLEIAHYTTTNSPLVSNSITALAINPQTGEVYMGTGNGIMSYQADAADASRDLSDIYAFPNPVHHNFTGLITIKGLVDDCVVKITDAAGNLVCETRSNGSIAVWNGCNGQGRRVASGVYYALCFNQDGSLKGRTRILVM